MSNEVAFNNLEKDDVKITFEEPSRVPAKPSDKEVAQHKKTRLILVVLFGIAVLAMVVVAVVIIIVSPRCKTKGVPGDSGKSSDTLKSNDTAVDDSWWKHAVIYQVYPRSFFDSNNDGDGDLNGITKKIPYFGDLGVNALWLNPIYESPMADGGYDVQNYEAIDKKFGTMEDFENFLKAAHGKGIKIIMDFVPNHTSEKHPWFVESKNNKTNSKRDWYIWRDGTGKNKTDPPNNWISYFGGSAWKYDDTTKQFYLHQFKEQQPDLNLRKTDVVNELKNVLKFWLDKGVDGFRFDAVQFLFEDSKFQDEPKNKNYNASDLKYDMLDHKFTHDLDEDHDLVKEFRQVLNSNKSHPLLIADVTGDYKRTSLYFEETDIPKNFGLVSKVKRKGKTLAQGIYDTIKEYLDAVPEGKIPNWVIGYHDVVRVGSRVGDDNRNAMNCLLLTLPGVVTSYYGEEIGMLNGNITNPKDYRDNERTPMQWSDEANAGFSTKAPWLPVAPGYKTLNVMKEQADPKSFCSNYVKLVTLRKEAGFASNDIKIVHHDEHVMTYTRGQDKEQYLVAINFGDKMWDRDFNDISGRGMMVFDSESDTLGKEPVDVNKIKLNPGQAVIVKKGDETWHPS